MKCIRFFRLRLRALALLIAAGFPVAGVPAAKALTFSYSMGPGLGMPPPGLFTAISSAGSIWSSKFSDPITVKVAIAGYTDPGTSLGYFDVDAPGVVGYFPYDMVKPALDADKTTASDISAVGALQSGSHLHMVTNDTTMAGSPRTSVASGFVYNSFLRLTRANQKALGLLPGADGGPGADGTIYLNTTHFGTYDFDPTDGITPGMKDAVAIITHEIGHQLGFISGVDHVDFASTTSTGVTGDKIFTALDLYRYSADSIGKDDPPASGETLDWAFGELLGSPPYFSIDAGATSLGLFATGLHGDGDQAQHWKDESAVPPPPLGLMDPDIGPGELGAVTTLDVTALDVIGYDFVVPEPCGVIPFALGGVLLWIGWRRR